MLLGLGCDVDSLILTLNTTRLFSDRWDLPTADADINPITVELDRNYRCSVWLSYAGVGDGAIRDLPASVTDSDQNKYYRVFHSALETTVQPCPSSEPDSRGNIFLIYVQTPILDWGLP